MAELFIAVVLVLHLMCVNVASAGPLVCIWFDWRGGRGDELANRVGSRLCRTSLALLVVGGVLGLLLGLLHWDDAYRDVLRKFPSKIFFGVWEMVFSLVLGAVTVLLWRMMPRSTLARWGRILLLLLSGTNLLYHFPFLFAIIAGVDAGELKPEGVVDAAVFRGLMMEGAVLPQAVHFGIASFAVVGITLVGYALWDERAGGGQVSAEPDAEHDTGRASDVGPEARRMAAWGARLALAATLCQIPGGIWLVVKLAPAAQQSVLGGDLLATGMLGVSLILSLGLLHHLSSLALSPPRRRQMILAISMTIVLVFLMTGVLQRI